MWGSLRRLNSLQTRRGLEFDRLDFGGMTTTDKMASLRGQQGKTRNLQQQVLASLLGHRCQTPLDGSGARRITLLILPTLLAPQSCEWKSGNGKFSGSERFISSVRGGIRKRGLAEVGWDKVGVVRANRRQ